MGVVAEVEVAIPVPIARGRRVANVFGRPVAAPSRLKSRVAAEPAMGAAVATSPRLGPAGAAAVAAGALRASATAVIAIGGAGVHPIVAICSDYLLVIELKT